MACTTKLLRIIIALGMLGTPACLTRDLVRPITSTPIAAPPLDPPPRSVEAPRPIIAYQSVSQTRDAVVSAPRIIPTLEAKSLERTEEPASIIGPELTPPAPATNPIEPPLFASMRLYMDRKPDDALRSLQSYGTLNQELMITLIPPLLRATEGDLAQASPQEIATLVDQLQSAASTLKARAALRMDTVCFCKRIVKFGVFDPLGENHSFRPGEMAELYVELRNLIGVRQTTPDGQRGFTTRLTTEMVLRDGKHKLVWREDCDKAEFTHSPRHDLDLHYRFSVPNIPAGNYTLSVKITDQATNRTVTRQIDFRVNTMTSPDM